MSFRHELLHAEFNIYNAATVQVKSPWDTIKFSHFYIVFSLAMVYLTQNIFKKPFPAPPPPFNVEFGDILNLNYILTFNENIEQG